MCHVEKTDLEETKTDQSDAMQEKAGEGELMINLWQSDVECGKHGEMMTWASNTGQQGQDTGEKRVRTIHLNSRSGRWGVVQCGIKTIDCISKDLAHTADQQPRTAGCVCVPHTAISRPGAERCLAGMW